MLPNSTLVLLSKFLIDFAGAIVNNSGDVAESSYPIICAIEFIFNSIAFYSLIKINMEAPSLIGEEFAAVTEPFCTNAGLRFGIFLKFTLLICSS